MVQTAPLFLFTNDTNNVRHRFKQGFPGSLILIAYSKDRSSISDQLEFNFWHPCQSTECPINSLSGTVMYIVVVGGFAWYCSLVPFPDTMG